VGPLKIWKKIFSSDGEISLLWAFVNFVIIVLFILFIYSEVLIYYSDHLKNESDESIVSKIEVSKPQFQFKISDNLFDENEMVKPGIIVYDGIIALPLSEENFIEDVFIEIKFPVVVEKFELVKQIGVEGSRVQLGNENLITLTEETFTAKTETIVIEVDQVKPGAFFRFKVYSMNLDSRKVDRVINYQGYFYWNRGDSKIKEPLQGIFEPKFTKLAEFDTEKIRELLKVLEEVNPEVGTLSFWTSDEKWFEKNGYFIDFIYPFEKEEFGIHIFRDNDNILKCEIDTPHFKNVLLQFDDLESLYQKPSHPRHMITVTWSDEGNKFYIDGELVDEYPK
jgi:hypothetical protein